MVPLVQGRAFASLLMKRPLLFLFLLTSPILLLCKKDGEYKLRTIYHNAERPPDISHSPLDENFHFPSSYLFPSRNDSKTYVKNLGNVISNYGLWDTSHSIVKGERVSHRPSYGCSLRSFSPWFSNAPSTSLSMCRISTVLVYSEQHSGTTLLTSSLDNIPSVSYMHGLFCCQTCTNETVGITTYAQLACAYQLHRVGISRLVILLQHHQFWQHLFSEAADYPAQNHLPVIILKRYNFLAHYYAGGGLGGSGGTGIKVHREVLKSLPSMEKKYRDKFDKMYCALKERGVRVMMITYEELANQREKTMNQVNDFMGMEAWKGSSEIHHVPLSERIENLQEVTDYLKNKNPEYLCLVYENCPYPEPPTCG
uniref:Protein-tyrosine sulfotransferase n=1 Tax=Paramoeba aestuarina TaxID=180227 RepID=A0A7S4JYC1_9EUKA